VGDAVGVCWSDPSDRRDRAFPTADQWTEIQLASGSAHAIATSLGEQNGVWTWRGTAESPRGTIQTRDHEQYLGKRLELWGEALLGGSWQQPYQASCRR
jgi:hypothetical protein